MCGHANRNFGVLSFLTFQGRDLLNSKYQKRQRQANETKKVRQT